MATNGNGNYESNMSTDTGEKMTRAKRLVGAAKEQALAKADDARTRFAGSIEKYAGVLDEVAGTFGTSGHTMHNELTGGAARALRELSRQVRDADTDELLAKAADVVKKRPALFAMGMAAVGFLGARLLLRRT